MGYISHQPDHKSSTTHPVETYTNFGTSCALFALRALRLYIFRGRESFVHIFALSFRKHALNFPRSSLLYDQGNFVKTADEGVKLFLGEANFGQG